MSSIADISLEDWGTAFAMLFLGVIPWYVGVSTIIATAIEYSHKRRKTTNG
jgi:hypothetical protein